MSKHLYPKLFFIINPSTSSFIIIKCLTNIQNNLRRMNRRWMLSTSADRKDPSPGHVFGSVNFRCSCALLLSTCSSHAAATGVTRFDLAAHRLLQADLPGFVSLICAPRFEVEATTAFCLRIKGGDDWLDPKSLGNRCGCTLYQYSTMRTR